MLAATAALALAGWVLAVLLASRPSLKHLFDVSPQARFSVTESTAELLRELRGGDKKLELHTIYEPLVALEDSERGRHILGLRQRVQQLTTDLLQQYAYLGGSAVEVRHHDLRTDLDQIRGLSKLVELGQSNCIVVKWGERTKVLSLDLDLAAWDNPAQNPGPRLPGMQQSLPLLADYKGEEAISSAIKSLIVEGTPTAYFLTGFREAPFEAATDDSYSELANALTGEGFRVRALALKSEPIPDDATVLALLEPKSDMSETEAQAIVDYLHRGGRFVLCVSYQLYPEDWNPRLEALGRRLGFTLGEDLVANLVPDRNNSSWRDGVPEVQDLRIVDLNPVHDITRHLARQGRFPMVKAAREIRVREGAVPEGVAVDPSLLRTSPRSWIETRTRVGTGEMGVDLYAPRVMDAFAARSVGAVIDVKPEKGERPGHAVVITGIAFNNLAFRAQGDLALNIFNWMAERKALVGVRGQKYVARQLQVSPQQVERIGWFLVWGVPAAMLTLGLFVLFWRSRR
jgi:hypothetical protein